MFQLAQLPETICGVGNKEIQGQVAEIRVAMGKDSDAGLSAVVPEKPVVRETIGQFEWFGMVDHEKPA